jgi:uncharacterized protein YejL (UPF0352 family)
MSVAVVASAASVPPAGRSAAGPAARFAATALAAFVTLFAGLPGAASAGPLQDDDAGQEAPTAASEKDLVTEFNKAYKSTDEAERLAAITALGDLSRGLEDKGTSKTVAKALAKGLDDESMEVRAAAVGQLAWGRHVDTVVAAFKGMIDDQRKELEKRITRPDDESKEYIQRGVRVFHDACRAVAHYKDDRVVDLLSGQMQALRPNTADTELSTRLVGNLGRSLLSLGTADAVQSAVRQTAVYTGTYQESAAKELHQALAEFATASGAAPPEYTDTYYVAWDDWFEAAEDTFPKKLGKLKEPPPQPDYDKPDMRGEVDDGGAAPR